jgi:hypothetical protein
MAYQITVEQKSNKWTYEIDDSNGFLVADDNGFKTKEDAQYWADKKLQEIKNFRGE